MVNVGVVLRYQKFNDGRCFSYISDRLRRTLQKAGAYVLPIAPVQDVDYMNTKGDEFLDLTEKEKDIIEYSLELIDGIVFPGGIKFTPYDRYVLERCIEKKIPILGICLGMQLLSCYQEDVHMEKNDTYINHNQENDKELTHYVNIKKDSKLYEIIGKEKIKVNSFHNFHAVENHLYKINAYSEDGLIEGIELPGDVFNIGVQWHPEISYEFDENSKKIIDAFIETCFKFRKEKNRLNKFIEVEIK